MTKLRHNAWVEIGWDFQERHPTKRERQVHIPNSKCFLAGSKDELGYQHGKRKTILDYSRTSIHGYNIISLGLSLKFKVWFSRSGVGPESLPF